MTECNPQSPEPITPKPPVRKKRRWRAIVLGLVILVSGFLLGAGASAVYCWKMLHIIQTPGAAAEKITKRLRWKLGLSEQQTEEVRTILIDREKAITSIFREITPQLRGELKRTREGVAVVLNPAQAKRWRKHFGRMQRMWFPGMDAKESPE